MKIVVCTALLLLWVTQPVGAAFIAGEILAVNYQGKRGQALISLGKGRGIATFDRGQVNIAALDNPKALSLGARLEVLAVQGNKSVVSLREKPGLQIPIKVGDQVLIDTGSGEIKRQELALLNNPKFRPKQFSLALSASQTKAPVLVASTASTGRTTPKVSLPTPRVLTKIKPAVKPVPQKATTPPKPTLLAKTEPPTLSKPAPSPIQVAQNLYRNDRVELDSQDRATAGFGANLPSQFLTAYRTTQERPSPEANYQFAKTLLDYKSPEQALRWLQAMEKTDTKNNNLNQLYQAQALADLGRTDEALQKLSTLPSSASVTEMKSYLYLQKGDLEQVIALEKQLVSPVLSTNRLIAEYRRLDTKVDRESKQGKEDYSRIKQLSDDLLTRYPDNPYLLNTIGQVAISYEDFDKGFDTFKDLSFVLNRRVNDQQLENLKANTFSYINNYNQNIEGLVELNEFRKELAIKTANGRLTSDPSNVQELKELFVARKQLVQNVRETFLNNLTQEGARPDLDPKSQLKAPR